MQAVNLTAHLSLQAQCQQEDVEMVDDTIPDPFSPFQLAAVNAPPSRVPDIQTQILAAILPDSSASTTHPLWNVSAVSPAEGSSRQPIVRPYATSDIPAERQGRSASKTLRKRVRNALKHLDNMFEVLLACNYKLNFSPDGTLEQVERDYNHLCEAISHIAGRDTTVTLWKINIRWSLDLLRGHIDSLRAAKSMEPVQYDIGSLPRP